MYHAADAKTPLRALCLSNRRGCAGFVHEQGHMCSIPTKIIKDIRQLKFAWNLEARLCSGSLRNGFSMPYLN